MILDYRNFHILFLSETLNPLQHQQHDLWATHVSITTAGGEAMACSSRRRSAVQGLGLPEPHRYEEYIGLDWDDGE